MPKTEPFWVASAEQAHGSGACSPAKTSKLSGQMPPATACDPPAGDVAALAAGAAAVLAAAWPKLKLEANGP